MKSGFFDKVVVKIEYKENVGSGVLISNSERTNSFLITAWHCLGNDKKIDFSNITTYRQESGELVKVCLSFQEQILDEEYDIAILLLEYNNDVPIYNVIQAEMKEQIVMVGYPNAFASESSRIKRCVLEGTLNDLPSEEVMQMNVLKSFDTYEQDSYNNIAGFSGSGAFIEDEKQYFLCGIVTELGSAQGFQSIINGISINRVDDKIFQEKRKRLPDLKWCSFTQFVDATLEIFDNPLLEVCSAQIPEIEKNILPIDIATHCKNKLVWPYSYKNLLRNEVWEAWLIYLIIRCIENHENVKSEKFYFIKDGTEFRKIKLLYSVSKIKLGDFLKDYLQNAYQDINNGELIILGTEKIPSQLVLSLKKTEEIVTNISSTISVDKHLYIDDVESNLKHISLIHIRAIIGEMERLVEQDESGELRGRKLEQKLSNRIMEVLDGIGII